MNQEQSKKSSVFGCLVGTAAFISFLLIALINSGKEKQQEKKLYKIAPTEESVDSIETI